MRCFKILQVFGDFSVGFEYNSQLSGLLSRSLKAVAMGRGKSLKLKINCCRKWCYFRMLHFQLQIYQNTNKIKNSNFLQKFHKEFSNFSQNFRRICVFRPKPQKLARGLINLPFFRESQQVHFRDENGTGKPVVRYGTVRDGTVREIKMVPCGTVNLHDEIID